VDRRFFLFLVLAFLVLMANAFWNARQAADQRAKQQAAAPAAADAANDNEDDADEVEDDEPVEEGADEEAGEANAADDEAADDEPAVEPEPDVEPEFATLGSVDPDSDYRMGVTFTNVGAAVRRLELSSPKYLDLDDRGGYLGHLELVADGATGLVVQSVVAGTPAAEAGLAVGDRLLAAGAKEPFTTLKKPADLAGLLADVKPRSKFMLQIDRDGQRQTLTVTLRRRPLEVIRPEAENFAVRDERLPPDFVAPPSFVLTLQQIDDRSIAADGKEIAGVDLSTAAWRIVDDDDEPDNDDDPDVVTFERRLPEYELVVTKRYRLARVDDKTRGNDDARVYHLTLEVTIADLSQGADGVARRLAYRLDGPTGLPVEGWWYPNKTSREWSAGGLRDVVGRSFDSHKPLQQSASSIAEGEAEPFDSGSLAYIGVDSSYFASALIPNVEKPADTWIATARAIVAGTPPAAGRRRFANTSCRLTSELITIQPGGDFEHAYTVFAGPKRPSLLALYVAAEEPAYSLSDFVYYGWFGPIAKAMVGLLHIFYGFVRNYGIAIIMLTVVIRGCMFPVSRGQARSMAKLQELRPEMERIKERYKGDQQKQAQEMQKLYRKHNVNPLGGCLPMLIQLPVFVGLWRGLAVDIELRQAPLFGQSVHWCSNLAGPDMFWDWSWFMPNFITRGDSFFALGPYLNLLPLVTVGLFLWQQKMFMPPPANEQAAMQQKIMKYMMVFMGILFYKVPSGLCLYSIASSLWGIGERKLFPPPTAATLEGASTGAGGGASTTKASTWSSAEKRATKNGQSGANRGGKSKRRR
jgi:YidC/Oxa1 family membrane protein insertase